MAQPEREGKMKYAAGSEKMLAYRRQIADIRRKMRDAQAAIEPQAVPDYGQPRGHELRSGHGLPLG